MYEIAKFKTDYLDKVLETMASQTHVLILIDTNRIFDEFIDKIICKLTKEGYVQHHVFKQDKTGAEAWVKSLNQMKKRVPGKESKTEHSDAGTRGATTRGVRFCPPLPLATPNVFTFRHHRKRKPNTYLSISSQQQGMKLLQSSLSLMI